MSEEKQQSIGLCREYFLQESTPQSGPEPWIPLETLGKGGFFLFWTWQRHEEEPLWLSGNSLKPLFGHIPGDWVMSVLGVSHGILTPGGLEQKPHCLNPLVNLLWRGCEILCVCQSDFFSKEFGWNVNYSLSVARQKIHPGTRLMFQSVLGERGAIQTRT